MATLPQRIPLTLEKHVSVLDKLVLSEEVDFNCLDALIKSELLQDKYDLTNYSQKVASQLYSNEKQQLEQYKKKYDKKCNVFKVQYKKPRHGYGRVFPDKSLGLTCLSKKVRNTLIKGHYCDIDLSNAQPAIVYNICKSNNIPCEIITQYINDREPILQKVMDTYDITRNDAKGLFIRLAFFGTFYGWKEELNLGDVGAIDFIVSFQNELQSIAETVKKANPIMYECCRKMKTDKKEGNVIGSFFSLYLQEYETRIMECVYLYLRDKTNIIINNTLTYEYDGYKLLKSKVEEFGGVSELIPILNQVVLEQTGFIISFEEKAIEKCFEIEYTPFVKVIEEVVEEISEEDKEKKKIHNETIELTKNLVNSKEYPLPSGEKVNLYSNGLLNGVYTDLDATEKLFRLYPYFVFCNGELYVFDNTTGMWVNNDTAYLNIIKQHERFLYLMVQIPCKKSGQLVWIKSDTRSYGNTLTNMMKLIPLLKTMNINDNWISQNQSSSLGKILFYNGYYDFKKGLFYDKNKDGFNPKIVFMGRIHHDFIPFEEEEVDYINSIKKRFFTDPLGEEVGDYFAVNIARAFAGDMMKRILFCLGDTDCGKTTISNAILLSFGDYAGSFNAENLAYRNTSNDEAQLMRWALLLSFKRIIISNEMKSTAELNGNMIKKISSGGDKLIGRNHCKSEQEFMTHFLAICFANDVPKIKPYDNAVDNRVRVINNNKQFVDEEPANENELKKDYNLGEEMKTLKFQRCFIGLLIREYYHHNISPNLIEPDAVKQAKQDWFQPENNIIEKFKTDYEITDNTDDYVKSSELEQWVTDTKLGISIRKLGIDLKKFCKGKKFDNVDNRMKKIHGKNYQVWFGIKRICEVQEVNEE